MAASGTAVPDGSYMHLFGEDRKIDRRTQIRTVPMEVLNMSFPRTGTMTVQTALEILGIKCYHSTAFFTNIADCESWDAAMKSKFLGEGKKFTRKEWDQLLGDYSGVSADPPSMVFAEDLIPIYPEAKVILVERSIESWFKSFSENIATATFHPFLNFIADLDPKWMGAMRDTHQLWAKCYFNATSADELRANAKPTYRKHYELVRRITPSDRLLEYKLSDGWEPLCKFLDKPNPKVPFPRVNDSAALWKMILEITRRACINAALRFLRIGIWILPVVGAAAWWWTRM